MDTHSYQNENMEEGEFGQLHAIHLNMNAIAAVRNNLPQGPSLSHCEECGDPIPEARRMAVPGVRHCVECKQHLEHSR
jgi:phage/conjugal plasmid C-4 type zinc finger TraR family protein